ncbi:MAG TPA: succinyl-diaminopimelate desuccinylase [Solirubrobacteraceae bacterium]
MRDLETRLAARTLQLVDIASESAGEASIVAHVLDVLQRGGVPVRDAGDTCVLAGATARSERRPFVLLAGHLDTVPAQGNCPGRRTREHVEGLGASDMKGGVAVMLELALAEASSALAGHQNAIDVGYVLFGREELPAAEGALGPLLAREAGLRDADLAIMLEPTANTVQAGCLGNLDAAWTFAGRAGHSARPWLAENAIDRAVTGIQALHAIGPSPCTVAGLDFTQVVSVTTLHAGIARNVIPGTAGANVNFRYSPDITAERAERTLRGWCEPYGEIEVLSNSPGARPPRENRFLDLLIAASGHSVEAKQAWTPVAELAAAGVEAVNFGPGDPAFAHRSDERVTIEALVRAQRILESVLCA